MSEALPKWHAPALQLLQDGTPLAKWNRDVLRGLEAAKRGKKPKNNKSTEGVEQTEEEQVVKPKSQTVAGLAEALCLHFPPTAGDDKVDFAAHVLAHWQGSRRQNLNAKVLSWTTKIATSS
jgi:hypothetical protein